MCAFSDFKRSEPMYMHVRNCRLNSFGDIDVVVTIEVRVNTTLQCYFSCTHSGSFHCAVCDVIEGQEVRSATQVKTEWAFGKTAELALVGAHVRVVDIAVVHPRDVVANGLKAQFICIVGEVTHFWSTCCKQSNYFVFTQFLSVAMTFDDFCNAAFCCRARVWHQHHWLHI